MGISLARRFGITVTLISGENSLLVDRLAAKMGIVDFTKGCKDKALAVRAFSERHALALSEICFMGDDINDIGAMELVGLAAAPSDARPAVLKRAAFNAKNKGGNGAVRELIDALMALETSPLLTLRDTETKELEQSLLQVGDLGESHAVSWLSSGDG